jgi:hypothetical protein
MRFTRFAADPEENKKHPFVFHQKGVSRQMNVRKYYLTQMQLAGITEDKSASVLAPLALRHHLSMILPNIWLSVLYY